MLKIRVRRVRTPRGGFQQHGARRSSLCFSTAVPDLLLKTKVRTPRGGPKQHGARESHLRHPHRPELAKICAAQTPSVVGQLYPLNRRPTRPTDALSTQPTPYQPDRLPPCTNPTDSHPNDALPIQVGFAKFRVRTTFGSHLMSEVPLYRFERAAKGFDNPYAIREIYVGSWGGSYECGSQGGCWAFP